VSLSKVGAAGRAAGDRVGALAVFEESLAIRRWFAMSDPSHVGWQADLAEGLYNLSIVGDAPRARVALREALSIAEALARDNKLTAAQQGWPQMIRDALAKLPPETGVRWPMPFPKGQELFKTVILYVATAIVWGGWAVLIGYWIFLAVVRFTGS
jgi:hypothetical protein